MYLIYSINTQTLYAYKTLLPELARDRATAERFRKEANIWVDLGQHPNFVNAVGVTEQMGRFFICMEYIKPDKEGVNSLDGHLRNGPIDFPQCLKWAIEFCCGMEFAYIKPEAVLLSWLNKGCAEATLHRRSDATVSFQRFLAVADPEFAQKYAKHIQEAKRFLAAD